MCGCLPRAPPPGTPPATQTCALTGNRTSDQPLGSQAGTQSTEPHQPGLNSYLNSNENTHFNIKVIPCYKLFSVNLGREREGENIDVREKHQLSLVRP